MAITSSELLFWLLLALFFLLVVLPASAYLTAKMVTLGRHRALRVLEERRRDEESS